MLNLLLAKDWVAGRDAVLSLIAKDVEEELPNRILMVPELISHDMERRLCVAAGDSASRFAEVLSFPRLGRRVSEQVGRGAQECLDNGGRLVAMAAAARQLHSKLKAYAAVETRPEFLTGLLDAVDEFKRCCITAEDLRRASLQSEGSFAQKLEELSLLLETYDSLCAQGKRDPRDQMTWLLEQLSECDFGQNHTFYIDGFPDFTRQHLAILEYLIQVSENVTVCLNCDCPGSAHPAFEKAGQTALALLRCAEQAGVGARVQTVEVPASPLTSLREALYQGSLDHSLSQEHLRVYRANSVQEECRCAVQSITRLAQSGCRYRQIGVVCGDMNTYGNGIRLEFARNGIPMYLSGTENILDKSVVSTVLAALDVALGNFERQDVLRYLKSMLSPVDLETCDLLENYAIVWNITGSRWLTDWQNHPDGLGKEWTEEARQQLARLNDARQAALQPLENLYRSFRKTAALSEQVKAVGHFLEEISLAQRLAELADAMDAAGDNRSAQILNQLWEILLSALEQLHDVLGHTAWEPENFTRLLTLLLSQYDVGTIPPVLDAVTVGPVSAMRCQQVEHLIVLGAEEGALPGYSGSTGVLSDQERDALRRLGVPLTGGSMEGLQAEFSEIYGVFCGARESVTVSCSGSQPSFLYRRLLAMSGTELPVDAFTPSSDPFIASSWLIRWGEEGQAEQLGIADSLRELNKHRDHTLGDLSREAVRSLYGNKLNLSASQIDRQGECRFSYFLKYGLRAQERKEAEVDPAEFGTYVHAVLEHTGRVVMERGGFHTVSLEETMTVAMDYSHRYTQERFSELDSQRMTYLFQRNIRELAMVVEELWRELSVSEFVPVGFEVAFGDHGAMEAVPISGGAMEACLRGFVDRVDAWSNGHTDYFRVVDYKTGRKDFDYCDVFNGIGLQMLIYMFALGMMGTDLLGSNPYPAGVQYFPARSPMLSTAGPLEPEQAEAERDKEWKRRGLVMLDEAVLAAMEPEEGPKRLPCKRSKDGDITGDVADREQMNLLREYLFLALRRVVDEIASGKIEPNPYTRGSAHNACTYCPYQKVCHFAEVTGRRNYEAMSAQRFWDEIRKEMTHHG